MIEMGRYRITIITFLLISSCLSGCFSEDEVEVEVEEEGKKSWWPDRVENNCSATEGPVVNSRGNYQLQCSLYLEGNSTPILTLNHPIEDAIWIVDLSGEIISWDGEQQTNVANISQIISRCHNEQGLLGMAFDEDFENTGMVILSYTEQKACESDEKENVVFSHAKVENGEIVMDSIEVLIEVQKDKQNHNGGHVMSIGNNHYLWSLGDGGSSFDPDGNGQNRTTKLGTIQLIQYENGSVSPVGNNSTEEDYTLHYGLRNPWRFDVDSVGNLWIADVGQNCYEEVNMVPVYQSSNFGWSEREGFHEMKRDGGCYEEIAETNLEFTDPVIEYPHENGNCSITGGYWMDWGPDSLRDGYIYGDFCTGQIWIIKNVEGAWVNEDVANIETMIVGFGRGVNDELLIFSWAGNIYEIDDL